ncbi:MAG: YrbL family protein [bacterium]
MIFWEAVISTRDLSKSGHLQIDSDPIGLGVERACYIHPDDPGKAVKVSVKRRNLQSKREIKYYTKLAKRHDLKFDHLPKYYGTIETNLGDGFIVELVRDYDGQISKSLNWYLAHGFPVENLPPYLESLKRFLLKNLIIFNYDMKSSNLLLQKYSSENARLVIIDGLGDTVYIEWLNNFTSHVESKINRRWERFIKSLYASREVKAQLTTERKL